MGNKPRVGLIIAICLVGLGLSAVLEVVHVTSNLAATAESFCTVNETLDCGAVALSRFSVVLGVPTPVWGIASFLVALLAAVRRSPMLLPVSVVGATLSVLLLIESLVHVHAICFLCEGVHLCWFAMLAIVAKRRAEFRRAEVNWLREVRETVAIPAGLIAMAMIAVPHYWVVVGWTDPPKFNHGVDENGNAWMGADEPTHVIEEYTDYACPHCKVASNQTKMLLEDAPGLRVVRRHQPRQRCTPKAKSSCIALRVAYCAGEQGKFWEMDSWLFANAPGKPVVRVEAAIEDVGVDGDQLKECMNSPEIWERSAREAKEARLLKIKETPGYFIDGERASIDEVRALF